jgi:hypothetical protein
MACADDRQRGLTLTPYTSWWPELKFLVQEVKFNSAPQPPLTIATDVAVNAT